MSRHDDPNLLREPTLPMPESLRSRLLAIPGLSTTAVAARTEADEIDRLYAAALTDDSELDADELHTTPLRAAVVRLLGAVFRDARAVRPIPRRLVAGLRNLRQTKAGSRQSRWQTRWVTEPRWAAAACWLLAFALTLGTGESVAGLLDAPTKLHARSSSWVQRAGEATGEAWHGARTYVREELWTDASEAARSRFDSGLGFARARTDALGAHIEAAADRWIHDTSATWSVLRGDLMPRIQPQIEDSPSAIPVGTPDSTFDSSSTNPGDPSPEEARDDR